MRYPQEHQKTWDKWLHAQFGFASYFALLEGIVSKSTVVCSDGSLCVHCHFDQNLEFHCRHVYTLGICQQMLGVTWLAWVMVVMSTWLGDHHHLGWRFLWFRFWAQGCRWVGVHGLHNALVWVATTCGCLGTNVGVVGPLACILVISSPFPSWACTYSPMVAATQAQTHFLRWTCFCIDRLYCSMRNPKMAWNIIASTRRSFVCDPGFLIFVGLDHNGRWAARSPLATAIVMNMQGARIRNPPPQHWGPSSTCRAVVFRHSLHTQVHSHICLLIRLGGGGH